MRNKRVAAMAMAVLVTASLPGVSFAGPSGAVGENEAKLASLQDNKLEYNEIGDLVENYNTTYKTTKTSIVDGLSLDSTKILTDEANELMDEAKDLRDEDGNLNPEDREDYEMYKDTAKALRKKAAKITNKDLSGASERALRETKASLTKGVQTAMIGYNKALANQELVAKQLELRKVQLDSTIRMVDLGMKSQEDVLAARQTAIDAEKSVLELQKNLQNAKQQLLLLTGWSYDAEPEIGLIPASDLSRIDAMNPQADLQDAIGVNYGLQKKRSTAAQGSADKSVKKRNISAMEQNLAADLKALYQAVVSKRQEYEAALSDFTAASQTMEAAERKRSLGMMGDIEYLGAQVSYLNSKAQKETADMELFTAMENYDWAKKGLPAS